MNFLYHTLIRPYVWHELPGWGSLYGKYVGGHLRDRDWSNEKPRTIQGKLHGYKMELDPSRWSERHTYFLGRFYDLETQMVLMRVLRPGDRVVDIGANIGMISLLASHLVGSDGVVDSFEPNPRCAERIRSFIVANQISNIRIHNLALGESPGSLPLKVPKRNSGEGTLTTVPVGELGWSEDIEVYEVPVRPGDDALPIDSRPIVLIKIDVEGFEHQALTGLTRTLNEHQPLVITEMVASSLSWAGRSPADLFDLMESHHYDAYGIGLRRKGLRQMLTLDLAEKARLPHDVLWVPRSGLAREKLGLA